MSKFRIYFFTIPNSTKTITMINKLPITATKLLFTLMVLFLSFGNTQAQDDCGFVRTYNQASFDGRLVQNGFDYQFKLFNNNKYFHATLGLNDGAKISQSLGNLPNNTKEVSEEGNLVYSLRVNNANKLRFKKVDALSNEVLLSKLITIDFPNTPTEVVATDVFEGNVGVLLVGYYTYSNPGSPIFEVPFVLRLDRFSGAVDFVRFLPEAPIFNGINRLTVRSQDKFGNYYIQMDVAPSSGRGAYLMRIDELGNFVWRVLITADTVSNEVTDAKPSPDASAIFVSGIYGDLNEARVRKLNASDGSAIWEERVSIKVFGELRRNESLFGVVATNDGGVVVGYKSTDFSTNIKKFVSAELDAAGNKVWAKKRNPAFDLKPISSLSNGYMFLGKKNDKLAIVKIGLNGELFPTCQAPQGFAGCGEDIPGITTIGEMDGSSYYLSNDESRPADAQTIAEINGGYLAEITSEMENNFVTNGLGTIAYIGLNDVNQEGELRWQNGSEVAYENISNCFSCGNTADHDYVVIHFWDKEWSWGSKWTSRQFIMEIPCEAGERNAIAEEEKVILSTDYPFVKEVAPNPVSTRLQVSLQSSIEDNVEVHILNANGTVIQSQSVEIFPGITKMYFDVTDLPSGIYQIFAPDAYRRGIPLRFVKVRK